MENLRIVMGVTGAFDAFCHLMPLLKNLCTKNNVTVILSKSAAEYGTKYYTSHDFKAEIAGITGKWPILSHEKAQKAVKEGVFDAMLIAPCSGNTLAKLALGIADTAVLIGAGASVQMGKPLIIAPSAIDPFGALGVNIGRLKNGKNIFFTPFSQTGWEKNPSSVSACFGLCGHTIEQALEGRQLQPMIVEGSR